MKRKQKSQDAQEQPAEKKKRNPWRPRRFETAQEIWDCFCGYCEWVEENPLQGVKRLATHKKATVSNKEAYNGEYSDVVPRPLTLQGFLAHANIAESWAQFSGDYSGRGEDFSKVISYIDRVVKNNQIEGAMSGIFKENIIARLQGLTDKQETQVKGEMSVKHMKHDAIIRALKTEL